MKSDCASGLPCLLPRVFSGRRPELLSEADRTSLVEASVYVCDGSGSLVPQTDAPTPFTSWPWIRPLRRDACRHTLL